MCVKVWSLKYLYSDIICKKLQERLNIAIKHDELR